MSVQPILFWGLLGGLVFLGNALLYHRGLDVEFYLTLGGSAVAFLGATSIAKIRDWLDRYVVNRIGPPATAIFAVLLGFLLVEWFSFSPRVTISKVSLDQVGATTWESLPAQEQQYVPQGYTSVVVRFTICGRSRERVFVQPAIRVGPLGQPHFAPIPCSCNVSAADETAGMFVIPHADGLYGPIGLGHEVIAKGDPPVRYAIQVFGPAGSTRKATIVLTLTDANGSGSATVKESGCVFDLTFP